jgi:hypothetical protein
MKPDVAPLKKDYEDKYVETLMHSYSLYSIYLNTGFSLHVTRPKFSTIIDSVTLYYWDYTNPQRRLHWKKKIDYE